VAPDAPEGTAFQKNTGANTIAVMYAKFLDVENYSVHFMLTNFPGLSKNN
jgi:hypothetical protein